MRRDALQNHVRAYTEVKNRMQNDHAPSAISDEQKLQRLAQKLTQEKTELEQEVSSSMAVKLQNQADEIDYD